MKLPIPAAAVVALSLLTAGCSSGPGSKAAGTSAPSTSSVGTSPAGSSTTAAEVSPAGKELDACALLSTAAASTLAGKQYASSTPATIAAGQDQCTYDNPTGSSLVVTIYQPDSGVSWSMLSDVLGGVGDVQPVTGVGDKAMIGGIELDAQAGTRLVSVEGAGGLISGNHANAESVAKAVIASLH